MGLLRRVCVYCGSGLGASPAFAVAARELGHVLADNGIGLVYGGGSIGLMGELASSVLDHGGLVTGVIPDFLVARERPPRESFEVIVTRDMHERKRIMFEKADAFVALPGGIGTLEELVEQLTWAQLGRHKKPILLANVEGFWNPLRALLEHMRRMQFIRAQLDVDVLLADKIADIVPKLEAAARAVSDSEKAMKMAPAERM